MFYVRSTDGVKLAVYDPNPAGSEVVLLIHGWPLSHKIYEYQCELLLARGYRPISMDLRGFGASDAPLGPYDYDQMAQDIYNVVCALQLSAFTLVGFSMGGAIVLRYMNRFQGYGVKRLLLLAAAAPSWVERPGFPHGLSRETVDSLIEGIRTNRPQVCQTFTHEQLFASLQSQPMMDWFQAIALSADGWATLQTCISLRDEDGRADLAAVQVPTFILHGAKDVVVSSALAQAQHEGIAGSMLFTLENSGHAIMVDQLQEFNSCFLQALQAR